ncbi:uncharacterized protein C17orf53 homolog isoform X2 [Heterocephalus glaber]|uniref:Uncharacterized protein C17orf53 homolog isoform X2 n=1 Tax=Heterocephalus glaber TaxID=10181 RepID=A0AAX6RJF6_HETGA|nr:uncharacterized protein C17orf53 homolog isoform X2 [Heterocephalus glaber]
MHQHRPEPAHSGLARGPGAPGGPNSPASAAAPSQALGPWTLFSVDEEFEDEDFLSALEDAESRLAGVPPRTAGHLCPTSSCPMEASRSPSPSPLALRPPAPGLCPPTPCTPGAVEDPCSSRTAPLRPLLTSSSWLGGQRPVWARAALEGPEQDKVGQDLAGLELELGAGTKDPMPAKRARITGPSGLSSNPMSARPGQGTPEPAGSPRATLPGHTPQLRLPTGAPAHCGPWSPAPRQPLLPPRTWAGGRPHTPRPQALGAHSPAVLLGVAPPSRAPAPPAVSPIGTLRGPRAPLQTPIVTNHLVQLVTAATPTRVRACRRRFPGPAGLLPQQGENPEEIVVSTLQTPAHGALAKLRPESLVTSSQASAEEELGQGAWLAMKEALRLDDGDPACFLHTCSVATVLRKAALKQLPGNKVPTMAVMIKSLTRSTVDASAVLRDPTGEMQGTLHRALLEAWQGELKPGAVLLLRQVGVFSPSLRNHYLNVTPSNLVHVYSPDSGDRDLLRPPQPTLEGPGSSWGRRQPDVGAQPGLGLRTRQSPGAGVSPEEQAVDVPKCCLSVSQTAWTDSSASSQTTSLLAVAARATPRQGHREQQPVPAPHSPLGSMHQGGGGAETGRVPRACLGHCPKPISRPRSAGLTSRHGCLRAQPSPPRPHCLLAMALIHLLGA